MTKKESKLTNEARLMFRDKCVMTQELTSIPNRINVPCLQYIDDPTNIPPIKIYNLVFEFKELKTEKNKNIIVYVFRGIEEV